MAEDKFEWTDELAEKFAKEYRFSSSRINMDMFKRDNTPKETKDKDFKIMSFMYQGNLIKRFERSEDCFQGGGTESYHLEVQHTIHSVRRLKDNIVFTIGDRLSEMEIGEEIIDGFQLDYKGNNIWISVNMKEGYGVSLDIARLKPKVPLFTTEDGVEIFDGGSKIYIVNPDNFEEWTSNGISCTQSPFLKYFSSEQKRFEYILNNKAIQVSYKEISEVITDSLGWCDEILNKNIKTFFKYKIQTP